MDDIDYKVIAHLMAQGRMAWSELAGLLALSAPATGDRVRRLEERQIITGYTALINPTAVGCHLTAFIAVTLVPSQSQGDRDAFLQKVAAMPEVQECHHMTGEDDYWLKVRCRDTRDLERVISDELKRLPGIAKTRTTIVLSTAKETPILPIKRDGA